MARIRSVSPELRVSETAATWPRECRYAFVLLWGYLDDYGRGLDNARVIAADCFPLDDDVTAPLMTEWLDTWEKAGSICRYTHGDKRYLHALNWSEYQKPQHPGKVRLPPCREHEPAAFSAWSVAHGTENSQSSGESPESLVRVSPTSKEGEGEGEGELRSRGRGRQPGGKPPKAPRCFRHSSPTLKSTPPCGECKELRIKWENSENLDKPALGGDDVLARLIEIDKSARKPA